MNFHIVPPPLPEEFKWLFPEKMKLPVDGSIAKEAAAESMREFI